MFTSCLTFLSATVEPAAADTAFTYMSENFAAPTFPPANWQATSGTWSQSCSPAPPGGGCFAVASVTSPDFMTSQLLFNPVVGIPANLENPTLTFTSNFSPDATTNGDAASVYQPLVGSSLGDLRQLADIAHNDAPGTLVTHTVPLDHTNLPLVFRWTNFGSTGATPASTWAIANVQIAGTLADIPYTLTANPVVNTQYHPVAGTPLTITLSGSSDPVGDTLNFNITAPPNVGTLGPVTPTDATHATVVYTTPVLACPNPNGVPTFICVDSFKFTVSDALGNVSSPANVALDVSPGGAGNQQLVISAPPSSNYVTVSQNGNLVQASDLSSAVQVGPLGFPDAVELHIQVASGSIELHNGVPSGVTFLNGTTSSGSQIHMKGSVAKINVALGLFLYFPPAGTTPTETINFLASDLGPLGTGGFIQHATASVTVNGISNAPRPVFTLPTGPLSVATTTGPLAFPSGAATGFTLVDGGATATTNDTVSLNVSGGHLSIPASDTTGPSPLVTAEDFGSTLNLTGTVDNLNLALSHVTFEPTGLPSTTVTLSGYAINPDTGLASLSSFVSITVVQGPYVYGSSSFSTLQNVPITLFLCSRGPAGAILSYSFSATPAHGTFVADPSASAATSGCSQNPDTLISGYSYTPALGYVGPDSFTYTVSDASTGLTNAPTTVSLTVLAHAKPTAFPVTASTQQDVPVDITLCGTNPDTNPALTFVIVTQPGHGSLVSKGAPPLNICDNGNQAETFTYTPAAGSFTTSGSDFFTYKVTNGTDSDVVVATITITTRTPQVISQDIEVDENGNIGIYLCSTTPNGGVTFTTSGPNHGTLDTQVASSNGPTCPFGYFGSKLVRYVPTFLYSGPDVIAYSVTDGSYTSALGVISITVNPIEIPPTANAQSVIAIAPHAVNITLSGSSLHNLPLTYRVVNGPTKGTLSGTAPNLVYTPAIASGNDSFTFVANDGVADGPPATVSITVVTPQLSSSVCVPGGPEISPNHFSCASPVPFVSDGNGGQVGLAHASGNRNAHLRLQVEIRNTTAAPDTVTIKGPDVADPWALLYATGGADRTADMIGSGVVVTLPAGGSAFVILEIFSPLNFPSPATLPIAITATSGNDPTKTTTIPIVVMDGTSSPAFAVTQADGTGRVTDGSSLEVGPPLFAGGSNGGFIIEPGIDGTGTNTFKIKAEVLAGSTPGIGVQYILGAANDVTSQVVAGTFTIQCYAGAGCPRLRAVLTPSAGSGPWLALITQTSTIDGRSDFGFVHATLGTLVGPDMYTSLPLNGMDVYEATPSTQAASLPVQVGGTSTKRVFLHNDSSVEDTFTVKADVTAAPGDNPTITIAAGPFGGPSSDATTALRNGTYKITLGAGDEVVFEVTDKASSVSGLNPVAVVLTATSKFSPTKVDSYRVTFPTYFYRPDIVLTGVNGQPIGESVYGGLTQTDTFNTSLAARSITVSFLDRGTGPWPALDSVKVKAPGSTRDFTLSYRMTVNGTTSDVTAAITGVGLDLSLAQGAQSARVLTISAASAVTGRPGFPGYFPITVTSNSSIPAGLSDVVTVALYNTGASQLRFGGLPQPEPADLAQDVIDFGLQNRTAPFPSAGYAPGITYGAYPDPSGQKFVYASAYDTFALQVAGENVSATKFRLEVRNPIADSPELPTWERILFSLPYFNKGEVVRPVDPLGAGTSVRPKFTVGGQDVTAQVMAGTYTTPALGTHATIDINVSFDPPSGASQRYTPLKFNLINDTTGQLEDVIVVGLSSIVECAPDGDGQHLATMTAGGVTKRLSFRSFDRTAGAGATECMQHLSHSWISKMPMVFSSYEPAEGYDPAGGYDPRGLWVVPQGGVVRVDTDTLTVTSSYAKGYVDTALTDQDGTPDPTTFSVMNYIGDFPNFSWRTTDSTTGVQVAANTILPRSPFPLVAPSQSGWPNNTMGAARYFQIQTTTGTPVMVGTMRVNQPWFHGDINLVMPVSNTTGLILNYAAPPDTRAKLPGDDKTETYGFFWTTRKDGKVIQGGCLGLPPQFFALVGIDKSWCIIGATTTFATIPNDPNQEAKIESITFGLKVVGVEVGTPSFNLKSLSGHINFDAASGRVIEVVVNATFGVGPPTPCAIEKKARAAAGVAASTTQSITDKLCPKNYFTFDAEVTFKEGGFTAANATTGYGIKFKGTLSFLGLVRLTSVEADIATDPFNFHFANSPIDVSVDAGISITAKLTLDGNVGANGFDISLSGSVSVMGQNIASASGILSTKGIGVCGGLAGVSVGFGQSWGGTPTFYPSGCTTSQYKVNE